MRPKLGIIGAGISGLTLSRLLSERFNVTVLEKNSEAGGIAKVVGIDGFPYHLVGGHCFNSNDEEVLDFVFAIMPEREWNLIDRRANIHLCSTYLEYPIEFAIQRIASIDANLASQAIVDFLKIKKNQKVSNLEEWFRFNFGDTLSELYFLPYNEKIWGLDPKAMNSEWVEGKLPFPDKKGFLNALFGKKNDQMVHRRFYYPKNVLQDNLIFRLDEFCDSRIKCDVWKIDVKDKGFLINEKFYFDKVIITSPLDKVLDWFDNVPIDVAKASSQLRFNQISNVLWRTESTDATWTYFPERSTFFHRHIHIGNFLRPRQGLTITEALGVRTFEEMVAEGSKFPYLLEPIGYNVSDHAYVLQDGNRAKASQAVKDFVRGAGLDLCGRFAEWEYYNMDMCIKSALDLARRYVP